MNALWFAFKKNLYSKNSPMASSSILGVVISMVVVAVPVGPVSSTSKKLWVTIPTFNQDSSVGPGGAIVGLGDKPSNAVDSGKNKLFEFYHVIK